MHFSLNRAALKGANSYQYFDPRTFLKTMFALVLLLMSMMQSYAVITATGDNTNAPPDDRGWQFVGQLSGGTATVVGERHVITTQHLNVHTNDAFVLNGIQNTVVRVFIDTNSELVICKMQNSFGSSANNWALLYTNMNSLVGTNFTTFGHGCGRGAAIVTELTCNTNFFATNFSISATSVQFTVRGGDEGIRFVVDQTTNFLTWDILPGIFFFPGSGFTNITIARPSHLQAYFRVRALTTITNGWELNGDFVKRHGSGVFTRYEGENIISAFTPDGCTITPGDSGGPVFVRNAGKWQIAAINYGSFYWPWSFDAGMTPFSGALIDQTGLWYYFYPVAWYTYPNGQPRPSDAFHTAVAPRVAWINYVKSL
jgi:hypothetical protein